MTGTFSPQISSLLDEFVVPELPEGFTDRVVAAAVGQKSAEADPVQHRPWSRLRSDNGNSPWKRSRFYASGIAGMAMLSTAAAAALSLADIPYRIPVVSDLVEQVIPRAEPAKIARNTQSDVTPEPSGQAESESIDAQTDKSVRPRWRDMDREEKIAVVKQRIEQNEERVQQRRAARGLPPLSDRQLRNRRIMIRKAIRSGAISRPSVRRALRRTAYAREEQDAFRQSSGVPAASGIVSPPATDIKPVLSPEALPARTGTELDGNSESAPTSIDLTPDQTGDVMTAQLSSDEQSDVPVPESETSDTEGNQLDEPPALDPAVTDIKDRIPPALRERLRNATPAERRRILREIRSRRQNGQSMREIRQRLRDMRRSGR